MINTYILIIRDMQFYTIKQAAKLSGLPASTLRFYETIKLIDPISRDPSSKQRVYSEDDINHVVAVACLNATGMNIKDIRTYLNNRSHGKRTAQEQIALLQAQEKRLAEEAHYLKFRQRYVATKILYWQAIGSKDKKKAEAARQKAQIIAKELRLPKE